MFDIATETSADVVFIPFQIRCWLSHVLQGREEDRLAAVALLSLLAIVVASPASVALIWDRLNEAAARSDRGWSLPCHLLIVNVAVVLERVVLAWAFCKLELQDHLREVPLTVKELPAAQV